MVTIDNPSIINPNVFLFAGLHVTSRHVGDEKQKHFSYWEQNYIFKNIFEEKKYRIDHQNGRPVTCLRTKN